MGMEQMDMFSFVDNLNKDPITNTKMKLFYRILVQLIKDL